MSFELDRRRFAIGAGTFVGGLALAGTAEAQLLEMKESKYNSIYVRKEGALISLMFGANKRLFTESLYDPRDAKALPVVYTRYMTAALCYPAQLRNAAEIGLGGGRTASYLDEHMHSMHITCVELDPEVIRIAKKWFGVKETPTLKLVAKDGRLYMRQSDEKFDLIMIDAYRGTFVPFHLLTKEFFQVIKSRLQPGGAVAQNIEPTTMMYDAAVATLRAVFDTVDIFDAAGNVVVVAYDGPRKTVDQLSKRADALQAKYNFKYPLPQLVAVRQASIATPKAKVLTDDFAPVEALRATEKHNRKKRF